MTIKQIFRNVEPIRPGYDWATEIGFAADFWDAYDLATGRLVAQFRRTIGGPLLFEASTDDGSMARPGGRVLALAITGADNATFDELVVFDFAKLGQGVRVAIPGLWQWPVQRTVTRNVE